MKCYRRFRGENAVEAAVRLSLERLSVNFIQEHQVGRWSIDFALIDKHIALEIDGVYWHDDPKKDARRDKKLERLGWSVLRISERELRAKKHIRPPSEIDPLIANKLGIILSTP